MCFALSDRVKSSAESKHPRIASSTTTVVRVHVRRRIVAIRSTGTAVRLIVPIRTNMELLTLDL